MTTINKVPSQKLWNPKSYIIFSLFFSFVPAGIMSGLNYGRCGDKKKMWIVLLSTIISFTVLITFTTFFTIDVSIVFIIINIGVGTFLWAIQDKLYKVHIENGGKRASYILPLVVGIIIFSLSTVSILYTINIPKKSLEYGNNHLFYTSNITNSQAKELGDYFINEDYFTNNSAIDVKIDKQKDLYILSIIIDENYKDNVGYIEPMKAISRELSKNVFSNNKIRIDLCNDRFKVLKSINMD